MIILGLNAYHPDAAVALIKDGEVIWAAEEERYSRIKHASGFPAKALQACLKETCTELLQIDAIAMSKDPKANLLRKIKFVLMNRPKGLIGDRLKALKKTTQFAEDFKKAVNASPGDLKAKFIHVEHHCAHVASSFYVSGYEQAAFLTFDGLGDFCSAMWGKAEKNKFEIMNRVYFPHSAGFLYTACTQFLGFHHFGDEYKVMGMAAYGQPSYLNEFRKIIRLLPDGRFELNLNYFTHQKGQAKVRWDGGAPVQDMLFSPEWSRIFGLPRYPEGPITRREYDIAASMQACLEEVYFHILDNLHSQTKTDYLCLAGGVAYNSLANGKIAANTPFKHIYIPPAAGDSGTAIGAALYAYYQLTKNSGRYVMNHALYGTGQSEKEIEIILKSRDLRFNRLSDDELIQKTVQALADKQVVGWFQGRMEFGPRALGSRSILAHPGSQEMKDILNSRVKHRENFRPFAPAVPVECANEFFETDGDESPFMMKVFPVKEEKQLLLQAITHADGTARVQTVSRDTQPLFWRLLNAFGEKTGVPVLINTSFNDNEPIVCTADDAVKCFLRTKMDILILENYFLRK
ncbi:MAG: carbamoyltransferase [Candidatus Omnitrophica bacterium]|nr:carbamoyltransferase [Candidatus Omnitrophota bacterium]